MYVQNVDHVAHIDAPIRNTGNHVCSSVKSAVQNACACLLVLMAISKSALVIITGRPKEEDLSAPEPQVHSSFYSNSQKFSALSLPSLVTCMLICCAVQMELILL